MKPQALGAPDAPPERRTELESGPLPRLVDLETAYAELLRLATELPVTEGTEAVARAVLDALVELAPTHAFGACLVHPVTGETFVEFRLPRSVPPPERDPTRLFPSLAAERALPLPRLPGSTLHVASLVGPLEDGSAEVQVALRAAALLASGLRTALALADRGHGLSAEVTALRAQVMQTEKLATLGQIVAGVVHELANPVTSIAACADFLLHKARNQSPSSEDVSLLSRIGVAADRILKFSRDLVTYARPATEEPGPLALHECIEQARVFCEHEFGRRNVTFLADYAGGSGPVLGQTSPLIQVFVNLFVNAAHAMEALGGGTLRVTTRTSEAEHRLYVDVTDTGVGIPDDAVTRIFEPFYTTKATGKGTGLGLSIVREIMQAHGGTVSVVSTQGLGTTFTLAFPLRTTEHA